jgi:hypothetical protein
LEAAPRSSSLHTFSKFPPPKKWQITASCLSSDLSSLAALETAKAGEGHGKEGWNKWEVIASTLLAVVATGSFLVASTMTSPSYSPKLVKGGGGSGGGGKPGGSSASPTPETEESKVSALASESGGVPYQVSVIFLTVRLLVLR